MPDFRVIDLRPAVITPECRVEATSPEEAANSVISPNLQPKGSPQPSGCQSLLERAWNPENAAALRSEHDRIAPRPPALTTGCSTP